MHPGIDHLTAALRSSIISGPFRALIHVDFRRFAVGQTVSLIGTWMQSIAQAWLVLELTGSAFAVGMVTTLNTLPILLFTLYGGVVADRVDKRRYIIGLQSVMLMEAATLATLALTGHITVNWVLALAVVHGTATAFEVPARQSYLVELVPREDLVSAAALNSTIYNLARVIGPSIAGVILVVAGPGICFAINAASYLGVLIGLFRITHRAPRGEAVKRPSVFTGVRFIRGQPLLRLLVSQMIVVSVFGVAFIPILPVFVREVLGTGASAYGSLTAALGVGAATGAVIVGGLGRRIPRSHLASTGGIMLGALVIILSQVPTVGLAMLCMALAGAAMATNGISTATSLQLAAPATLRGQVMAVYSFVVLGLVPFGSFQAGWVAEHFGASASIAVSGLVSLAGALVLRKGLWHSEEV
ncbi:MAG TPA: MFS transporter [Gemmatimonadales bacterium]|nr:MFS transporter [Gemmatimonadales bacterium]